MCANKSSGLQINGHDDTERFLLQKKEKNCLELNSSFDVLLGGGWYRGEVEG